MSRIFWYHFLSHWVLFSTLFIYLFVLLVSGHYCLDVSLFEKIQDYEEKTLSSSKWEARQVTLDHIDPMCIQSLVHILACML
jgi:thiosulfate reductase cytochrome b subunit